MSNLSQFFALGGNKIKSIQTVTASQVSGSFGSINWSGAASISEVDPSKTLLICSPSSNSLIIYFNDGAAGVSNTGHGAYLIGTNQVAFYGPRLEDVGSYLSSIRIRASMVVQVVEFE